MVDVYKLWPARAAICDPKTGLATSEFTKALGRIAALLGGENNTLPVTFIYVPAGGTANGIVYLNALGELTSTAAATNGQFLIGRTGLTPALGTIAGTVNRVTVTLGSGTITLTAPQDIHSGASPTFNDLTLSGLTERSFLYSGAGGAVDATAAPTNGQLLVGSTGNNPVAAALTGTANQVTVTNGAGSITLSLPQNIAVGSSPTFAGLTLSGLTANAFTYSGAASLITSTAAPTNGQLLIGSTGAAPVAAAVTGTANQVVVANGAGSITLSLPQNIHTGATPDFAGLVGTVTNDDAATGVIGEYIESIVASGSAVSLTSGVAANITSISLTAGDWDVDALIGFSSGAATTSTYMSGGPSSTSATLGPESSFSTDSTSIVGTSLWQFPAPKNRFSLASTTTIYLVAKSGFSASTMAAYGKISARRAR